MFRPDVKVLSYQAGDCSPDAYLDLIHGIYGNHPRYAAALAAEVRHQLAPESPFLSTGTRTGFMSLRGGEPSAHACAITDRRLPADAGLVGFFEAVDAEGAQSVLAAACGHLASRGVTRVYGPVSDSTWQRYGVAVAGGAPPFSGEPFTPAAYAGYFIDAGFSVFDRRFSATSPPGELPFRRHKGRHEALLHKGFVFTEVPPGALAARGREVHAIVNDAFGGAPLFVRVSLEEFLYFIAGRADDAGDALLVMAHDRRETPVAFLWGLPDRCSGGERFIFKTIGVIPEYHGLGLGSALFYRMQRRLEERAVRECIFSTMRSGNPAMRSLVAHGTARYRDYLTFGREVHC